MSTDLSNKIKNHSSEVSSTTWNKIDQRLKEKKRRIILFFIAFTIASIGIGSLLYTVYFHNEEVIIEQPLITP
jgi:hypothetical protein